MAGTAGSYTYQQAADFAQKMAKGIPITNLSVLAVAQVAHMFWKAYPWPWARDTLTPIPLVDGVQDYALDNVITPDTNRVWRLTFLRVVLTSLSPNDYRDVRIRRHLEPLLRTKVSWPNFQLASYEVELDKIRMEAAVSVPSGTTMQLEGGYQLFSPNVTDLGQTCHFPDYHLDVFVEGLLWMLFRLADDDRAGAVVKTSNGVEYTGQLGLFYDKIVMTKEQEEHGAEDSTYPEESIGGGVLYFPGVYGF